MKGVSMSLTKGCINWENSNTNPVSCFMHLNKPLLEFLEIQRKIISMTLITAFSAVHHCAISHHLNEINDDYRGKSLWHNCLIHFPIPVIILSAWNFYCNLPSRVCQGALAAKCVSLQILHTPLSIVTQLGIYSCRNWFSSASAQAVHEA